MLGYDWPQLHAALNDLPTALLLAAAVFELVGILLKRPSFHHASFWTLVLALVGTAAAVLAGLEAEDRITHSDAVHAVLEHHEQLGLITLSIVAVVGIWRIVRERRMGRGERAAALLVTMTGVGVMLATARHGGELVFEYGAGIPTAAMQTELQGRLAGHSHEGAAEHEHAAPGAPAAPVADSAPDSAAAESAGHTHAPGTPPHEH